MMTGSDHENDGKDAQHDSEATTPPKKKNEAQETQPGEANEEDNDAKEDAKDEEEDDDNGKPVPTTPAAPAAATTPTHPHQRYPAMPPGVPYYPFPFPMPAPTGIPSLGGGDHSNNNPYGYKDVSKLGDPAPDIRRNRGGVTEPFPEKLHRMLEYCEREGMADVASFFSHGRAFAIHKPRRFVTEVMPRFFRQTKLTSFQRQLNLYGFRRISQGPDNGGYYHELFLKGRPGLCINMKRLKIKGDQKNKKDPDSEPNFYTYPPLGSPDGTGMVPPQPPQGGPLGYPPPGQYGYPPPGFFYSPPPYNYGPYTGAQYPPPPPPGTPPHQMYPPYPGYGGYPPYPYPGPPHPIPPSVPQHSPVALAGPTKSPDSSKAPDTPMEKAMNDSVATPESRDSTGEI